LMSVQPLVGYNSRFS